MPRIRVLVVDDAVVVRRLVSEVLGSDPEIEVVGVAPTGRLALAKLPQLNPDVVTLDIEMPGLSGLETLVEIKAQYPEVAVIMLSAYTERGAAVTLEALALGASDYLAKPTQIGRPEEAVEYFRNQLIPKVKALAMRNKVKVSVPQRVSKPVGGVSSLLAAAQVDVIAIGVSTGGPNALACIISQLPKGFPVPILIVQHMPPLFTRLLAERLSDSSCVKVCEALEGGIVDSDHIWLARGDYHMVVDRVGAHNQIAVHQGPLENSCRPSVDVLFRSVASVYGPNALAVVLTGMGRDGLRGSEEIKAAGGQVLVQDEQSSVVWGMPGYIANAGLADSILPLEEIAQEITRRVWLKRAASQGQPKQEGVVNHHVGEPCQ